MNPSALSPSVSSDAAFSVPVESPHRLSWGAILAGTVAALTFQILFMLAGAGIGFAIFSPLTDRHPAVDFSAGAAVVEGISAVLSLWFGGWVAGRFTPERLRRTGWMHGLLVWCLVTLVGVSLVSGGASWAAGGLSRLAGSRLGNGANDLQGIGAQLGMPNLGGRNHSGQASGEANAAGDNAANANASNVQAAANHAVNAVTEPSAEARVAADNAAHELAIICLAAFIALAFGATAASVGGRQGADAAERQDPVAV